MEKLRNSPKKPAHIARTTLIADTHLTALSPAIDTFNHTSPDQSLLLIATVPFRAAQDKKKRTVSSRATSLSISFEIPTSICLICTTQPALAGVSTPEAVQTTLLMACYASVSLVEVGRLYPGLAPIIALGPLVCLTALTALHPACGLFRQDVIGVKPTFQSTFGEAQNSFIASKLDSLH